MVKPLLQNLWVVRLLTAFVWAVLAAIVLFWVLALSAGGKSDAAQVAQPAPLAVDADGVLHLLAGRQIVAAAPKKEVQKSAYQLVGVLAGTQSQQGSALIALNGQLPKPYRVGATIEGEDGYVLQALSARAANLGFSVDGDVALVLELPEYSPSGQQKKTAKPAFRPSTGAMARPQVQRDL